MKASYKIALCGVFSALSAITFTLENLFPPLFIPGARLGLSNLFVLLSLTVLGVRYALVTLSVKALTGCFSSGFFSLVYSLPAGFSALAAEIFLIYPLKASVVAASVTGSVINSVTQNAVFCLTANASEYLVYLPYLALTACLAGLAVGFALYVTLNKLPDKLFKEDEI